MTIRSFAWVLTFAAAAAALLVAAQRRCSRGAQRVDGRAIGWTTADDIKQAASTVLPHELESWP